VRAPECWSVLFVLVISVTASADEEPQKKDDPFAGRRLADVKKKLAEIAAVSKASERTAEHAALRRLKAFRYLAGVPYEDVVLDAEMNRTAKAAAEICAKLGRLDHSPRNPGLPEEQYELARKGAASSNLGYFGRANPDNLARSVDMFMDDSDAINIDRVGHRRWCLNPAMKKVGFGQSESGKFTAMMAHDSSRDPRPDFDFISWPPRGPVPVTYFSPRHAWNVSLNPAKYKAPKKDVKVVVQEVGGKALMLNYTNVNNDGFGVPACIIFRPDLEKLVPGKRYQVQIDDLEQADGTATSIRFVVTFVSLK